ncbi:MAG TPA: cupin domain-containing protein [Caulobacteraceae bacterium]|nr:cupin domain-containing protein [Caulobacteraceae bacterium]
MNAPARGEIGQQIRRRRRAHRMSLQQMSDATGLSISTLSKIENDLVELSYTRMIAISEALGVNLTELMTAADVGVPSVVTGRRSITRAGEGALSEDDNYISSYLNTDISKKQMIPAIVTVKHRSLEEFGPMSRHKGEEFILVLSGEIELHTEYYNPVVLTEGESVYIDSTMPHAMISVGKRLAQVLSVCTHQIEREGVTVGAAAMPPGKATRRGSRPSPVTAEGVRRRATAQI